MKQIPEKRDWLIVYRERRRMAQIGRLVKRFTQVRLLFYVGMAAGALLGLLVLLYLI